MKKSILCSIIVLACLLFLATTVFSGAPYRWPKDTGGDPEAHGEDANGWDYFVDFHSSEGEDWIEPMIWCEYCQRWEDPMMMCMPEAAWIGKDGKKWKIVGGGYPGMAINPKIALHPDINDDLDGKEKKRFKLGVDLKALPGGASLRIFI